MTTPASFLPPDCSRIQNVTVGIRAAYEAWRTHWEGCPTCHLQDWFEPGAPLIRTAAELTPKEKKWYVDRKREVVTERWNEEGERIVTARVVVYVFNRADYSTLCPQGRSYHQLWAKEAAMHEFPN